MLVNHITFFISTSRHIKFTTAKIIGNAISETLLKSVLNIARLYTSRGFKVKEIHMDGQFVSIRGDLLAHTIHLNVCSEGEHVREIKRQNRTVKERVCGNFNTLPFKKMPGCLIARMIYSAVFCRMYFTRHARRCRTSVLVLSSQV